MTAGIDFAYAEERQPKAVIVGGSDPARHVERRQAFAKAAYDHIAVYQIVECCKDFFRFYASEVLSKF
jgi:hypothetical protein